MWLKSDTRLLASRFPDLQSAFKCMCMYRQSFGSSMASNHDVLDAAGRRRLQNYTSLPLYVPHALWERLDRSQGLSGDLLSLHEALTELVHLAMTLGLEYPSEPTYATFLVLLTAYTGFGNMDQAQIQAAYLQCKGHVRAAMARLQSGSAPPTRLVTFQDLPQNPWQALTMEQMQQLYASQPLPNALPVPLSELERLQGVVRMRKPREGRSDGFQAVWTALNTSQAWRRARVPRRSRPAASSGAAPVSAPELRRLFTMSASRPMLTDESQASSSQAAVHEDVLRGQEERLALVDDEDMQNLVSDLEVAARKEHVELKPADCSGRTEGPADVQGPVLREELGLSAAGLPVASAALPPATSQARAPCTEDSGDRWNGAGLAQQPQALLNCMQDVSTALDQRSGVKRPAAAVEKLRTGLGCDEDRGQAAEPEQRDEPRPRRPRGRPAAAVMSAKAARAGPCKRPAGSVATGGQPAPCRRPAAVCALKRPAARRGVKPRHDGLRPVPAHLLAKYKNGCSTCRYTPGCCPSCWRKRGY